MKKILMMAVVAFGMLATACSKDEVAQPVVGGEESVVTFTVEAPVMATRAHGDGTTATQLSWAVYDENDTLLFQSSEVTVMSGLKATVEIPFVNGMEYNILFWAEAEQSPYSVEWANLKVGYKNQTLVSNSENYDAFYCYFTELGEVTGPVTKTVELKRPFAQLNIITNDADKAKQSGVFVENVAVTVKNGYSSFNLAAGKGDTKGEVTFGDAAKQAVADTEGVQLLAVNYLFTGGEKSLVDVVFSYTDENNKVSAEGRTMEFATVPVQRNYRTNIVGSLLTSEGKFNIEIEKGFADEEHNVVSSAAALEKLLNQGGDVTLDADYVLDRPVIIAEGKTVVLDMNGKTLKGTMHKNVGAVLKNEGTLTIVGGTISSTADNGGSAIQNNGTLTINDATLNGAPNANGSWPSYTVNNTGVMTVNNVKITSHHGAVASYGNGAVVTLNNSEIDMAGIPGFTSHGMYTYNNGKVIVNGGTYANKATDQAASGASVINGAVEVNDGTFSGRIENYYGTPVLKGGTYSVKPNKNFVATGFQVIDNGNSTWSVVSYASILEEQINLGGEVTIDEDMLIVEPIVVVDGVVATLNLNNKTLEGTMPKSIGAVLKNEGTLTVKGGVIKSTGANGGSAIQNNGTLTVEDATVIGSSIRENEGWPSYPINNYGDITIKNTSITGYQGAIACNAAGTTTVENCVVNKEYLNTSSHTFYIVHADANVIVNGGTYTHNGMDGSLAYVYAGSITINDGVFTASNGGYGIAPLTNGKVIINGGTFNNAFLGWGGAISINGGIFKSQPKAEWIADGLKAIKSGDNYVVVAEGVNGVASTPIAPGSEDGETYTGELFENPITNALYYNNWILNDDATITIGENNFGAIILENVEGNLNGNVIEVNNTNNPVMVLQNCNFTLKEGKKLIKSTNTIYQVFMANITINGVKLTNENAGQYLENVGWFQVVEEI